MDETSLRAELAQQYHYLAEAGLTELASGNLSARLDDGMLISPTGATGSDIAAADFVALDLDGEPRGDGRPSSEWPMHAAIYRAHSSAGAVVHTHSDHCVALASHERPLPGFHYLVGTFGGTDVPCVPYSTFGSQALASAAAEALRERNACLLGRHGMISRGESIGQAVALAHRLEIMCRQYLLACQYGEPAVLTEVQWQDFFAQAAGYPLI